MQLSTAEKEAKAAGLKEQGLEQSVSTLLILLDSGNKALAAKNFDQAVDFYTQALALMENHIFRSNRHDKLLILNTWQSLFYCAGQLLCPT